jgi:hypothetical protein
MSTPPAEPLSFEKDIKPLFREQDRSAMSWAFDLWSHEDVSQNADGILERLRDGSMPCDTVWPKERIDTFERWAAAGTSA